MEYQLWVVTSEREDLMVKVSRDNIAKFLLLVNEKGDIVLDDPIMGELKSLSNRDEIIKNCRAELEKQTGIATDEVIQSIHSRIAEETEVAKIATEMVRQVDESGGVYIPWIREFLRADAEHAKKYKMACIKMGLRLNIGNLAKACLSEV